MDYEKKYNEALSQARFYYGNCPTEPEKKKLEKLFPELRESEDEIARKAALEGIEYLERKLGWDAIGDTDILDVKEYLEKQKESHYPKRNALFDKCVENCDPEVMEEVSNKVDEMLGKEQKPNIELIQRSWYMEGYHDREFGKEPKWILKTGEGGPKHELNPRYGQHLVGEQKPTEEQLHNLNEAIKGLRMDGCERMADSLHSLYNILTAQEQKPAEWNPNYEDVILFNKAVTTNQNLTPSERAKLDIIRTKFKHCNGHIATSDFDLALGERYIQGYNDALEELKPAWSDEDEKMLNDCIMALLNWRDAVANYGHEVAPCQKLIDWLKSLRPGSYKNCNSRWKPSEEHLSALLAVFNDPNNIGSQTCQLALTDLYEQLKKLM